jgi:hypothetical protein
MTAAQNVNMKSKVESRDDDVALVASGNEQA